MTTPRDAGDERPDEVEPADADLFDLTAEGVDHLAVAADDALLSALALGGAVPPEHRQDPVAGLLAALRTDLEVGAAATVVSLEDGRRRRSTRHLGRGAVAALALGAVAFAGTGVAAALDSQPGDLLYGVRRALSGPVDDASRRAASHLVDVTVSRPVTTPAQRVQAQHDLVAAASLVPQIKDPGRRAQERRRVEDAVQQLGLPPIVMPSAGGQSARAAETAPLASPSASVSASPSASPRPRPRPSTSPSHVLRTCPAKLRRAPLTAAVRRALARCAAKASATPTPAIRSRVRPRPATTGSPQSSPTPSQSPLAQGVTEGPQSSPPSDPAPASASMSPRHRRGAAATPTPTPTPTPAPTGGPTAAPVTPVTPVAPGA